ncbi:GtrA family protein [Cellulomonas sp. 179-A 4D5 NHS]|uniref:GtrA family protein n=1 Tax=Cellulomonas sp. 179-A 4D5 NHS TaxID=3142378 RepID=UPI0039A1C11F
MSGRTVGPDEAAATGLRARLSRAARHQVGRFASVGVVNTLVDLGLFLLLSWAGAGLLLANTVSTTAGMAVSFLGNRRFVFGRTGHVVREVTLFFVVCAIGIWVIQPAVIVAVVAVVDAVLPAWSALGLVAGKCSGILVAAVWNFFLYKHLVFRPARTSTLPPGPADAPGSAR